MAALLTAYMPLLHQIAATDGYALLLRMLPQVGYVASLASKLADTASSEIGKVSAAAGQQDKIKQATTHGKHMLLYGVNPDIWW
jgi:hypothetical protein